MSFKKSCRLESVVLWILSGCLLFEAGDINHNCETMGTCTQDSGGCGIADQDCDGFSVAAGDCDDQDPLTFPGAAEHDSAQDCMQDRDQDGFGAEFPGEAIRPGTDCDDSSAVTFPGAGFNEPGLQDQCSTDSDGDGFLSSNQGGTDCDPLDPLTHPGSSEFESGIDRDCDGLACAMPVATPAELALMITQASGSIGCEAVWIQPDFAISQDYCARSETQYAGQQLSDPVLITEQTVSSAGLTLFRLETTITSTKVPIVQDPQLLLDGDSQLFVGHHNIFGGAGDSGQFELQQVELIEAQPNELFVSNIPESGGGAGLYSLSENGYALVGTVHAEAFNVMTVIPAHLLIEEFLEAGQVDSWPVLCD